MQSFDPITLQCLIDGELDEPTTRHLLSMSEDHPHLWREVALGFVEDQIWRNEFNESLVATAPNDSTRRPATTVQPSRNHWNWLAMAAGMLLTLTVGYWSGKSLTPNEIASNVDSALVANNKRDQESTDTLSANSTDGLSNQNTSLVSYEPDYHLELEDPHGNPVLNSQVPLYSYQTARQMSPDFWNQESRSSKLREQFADSGYFLDENTRYISGQTGDGRQIVIPVRTTNFSAGQ